MINYPSTAFMQKINDGDIPLVRMQLVTADGRTIWLEDGQFWGSGISFSEATSQDGEFCVGSAIIGQFSFSLTNFDRSLDSIDFAGATVIPTLYYEIDGEKQYLAKGVFYVTTHTTSGNIINCTAMDAMKLLDQSQTEITYPITVQNLVNAICIANGLTLDSSTSIPNGDMQIAEPHYDGDDKPVYTDRQMLSYACQLVGCYAKINELGHMVVDWYDFENPIEISTTFDGKSLWTQPIMVTGVQVEVGNVTGKYIAMSIDAYGGLNYMRSSDVSDVFVINEKGELVATADSGVTYTLVNQELIRTANEEEQASGEDETAPEAENVTILYGTDERVVKLTENPYITISNVQKVCENISDGIFGIPFRPGTLPVLANPCLQAGDVLRVTDRNSGLVYLIPITSTVYNKVLIQNVICSFENKEDQDLRPNSSYNMRLSVENAIKQAQNADDVARAAQEMAETSGYQPYIVSDKGTAFTRDTSADLTAVIYDKDMNEVDPDGTGVIYRWWITKDGTSAKYLDGGKVITIPVSDALCDYAAGIYFETKDISEGVNPFLLARRGDTTVLTTRSGIPLAVRAAERVGA